MHLNINSKIMVKLFKILGAEIEKIGEQNILQVVTNNHSSYVLTSLLFISFNIAYLTFIKFELHEIFIILYFLS